jgi:hypothetical protein
MVHEVSYQDGEKSGENLITFAILVYRQLSSFPDSPVPILTSGSDCYVVSFVPRNTSPASSRPDHSPSLYTHVVRHRRIQAGITYLLISTSTSHVYTSLCNCLSCSHAFLRTATNTFFFSLIRKPKPCALQQSVYEQSRRTAAGIILFPSWVCHNLPSCPG